jgi:uncharacterized Zn finger protein
MFKYIYYVKCPGRLDEHFDFFDHAKSHALSCLGQKPIITQIELDCNDYGECVDSTDLGTVWSWEDAASVAKDKPEAALFTKGHLAMIDDDPEFAALDNSLDTDAVETDFHSHSRLDDVPDNFRRPIPEGMTIEQLVEEMEENEDTVECKVCGELRDKSVCSYDGDYRGWVCSSCDNYTDDVRGYLYDSKLACADELAKLLNSGKISTSDEILSVMQKFK